VYCIYNQNDRRTCYLPVSKGSSFCPKHERALWDRYSMGEIANPPDRPWTQEPVHCEGCRCYAVPGRARAKHVYP
jgi:hypothetical protein